MKKLTLILLSVLMIVTLAACGDKCEHTYDNACDATCNDCGETREVSAHQWKDATCTTLKTCTVCGTTEGEMLPHNWEDATCITAKTCKTCGTTEGEPLGHKPAEDDGDCGTDVLCTVCGAVLTSGKTQHIAHADDGDCTTPVTCTECSTVITAAKSHDFSGALEKDASGHWHVCANEGCTKTDTKADHISDGAATEEKAEKCTVCEHVITPELDHTHNHNIPKYDTENHWIECACGDKSAVTAHSATDDNDCTTADVCSCGHTVRAAHDHTPGKDDGNCMTEIKCTECGKTAVAGATDHNDTDHDYICDNGDCQITLDGAPKDENEGIDLPLVPNN